MSSEIWDVQVIICDIQRGLADGMQDADRGIILDQQLEAVQVICRTFQMAPNIYDEGGETRCPERW